jgi:hypothetical protein
VPIFVRTGEPTNQRVSLIASPFLRLLYQDRCIGEKSYERVQTDIHGDHQRTGRCEAATGLHGSNSEGCKDGLSVDLPLVRDFLYMLFVLT